MKKMPCLFVREFHGRSSATITREVTPGCEWVLAGEGTASRKWDGTACAVIGGVLHKRYDAKAGKTPPAGAVPCQPEADPVTGHWPHWVKVGEGPEDRWHREALADLPMASRPLEDGTYELVGPMVGGNAEGRERHEFLRHGSSLVYASRDFDGLNAYLSRCQIEGIVFAHPDGRKCKIRRDDFGLAWGSKGKR